MGACCQERGWKRPEKGESACSQLFISFHELPALVAPRACPSGSNGSWLRACRSQPACVFVAQGWPPPGSISQPLGPHSPRHSPRNTPQASFLPPAVEAWAPNALAARLGGRLFKATKPSGGRVRMELGAYLAYSKQQHDEEPVYVFDA